MVTTMVQAKCNCNSLHINMNRSGMPSSSLCVSVEGRTRWVRMTGGQGAVVIACGGMDEVSEGEASSSHVGGQTRWMRMRQGRGEGEVLLPSCVEGRAR